MLQIVKKPYYELHTTLVRGKKQRTLVVLNPSNIKYCYIYNSTGNENIFLCKGCKKQQKNLRAELIKKEDDEHIELLDVGHICNIVSSPIVVRDFEIRTQTVRRRETKTLISYDINDRTLCYYYYFRTSDAKFVCSNCVKIKKFTSAKKYEDDGGNVYYILSNEHYCIAEKYKSQSRDSAEKVLPWPNPCEDDQDYKWLMDRLERAHPPGEWPRVHFTYVLTTHDESPEMAASNIFYVGEGYDFKIRMGQHCDIKLKTRIAAGEVFYSFVILKDTPSKCMELEAIVEKLNRE